MKPSQTFADLPALANALRQELDGKNGQEGKKYVLLYAYNGTGKTRLSMAFKDAGKNTIQRPMAVEDHIDQPQAITEASGDTLYFNAFTEDLFHWDNDLDGDSDRRLLLNMDSRFFKGVFELEMDNRIRPLLQRYADFDFRIDTQEWSVRFSRTVDGEVIENIKVSRGEENIFIWCFFLAIFELAMDPEIEAYQWVKYVYIDDPISSLDEHNAITLANHLAKFLARKDNTIKAVISSHHTLFFNVLWNELRMIDRKKFAPHFLSRSRRTGEYSLSYTGDTPFYHHLALLEEICRAKDSGELYTHHFNALRSLLEKSSIFHGYEKFSVCIKKEEDGPDETLYLRLVQIMNHGNYSFYDPVEMLPENKEHFEKVLADFLEFYPFNRELLANEAPQEERQ
ncbi:AAA family ATPase [Burkholderia pseudomallei]|uniref:AAA family ATPase n=1 Tax=Burkholderia pseudomallei TaxID=28450 RepID=UPI00016ACA40|nr:AAA family ATPase [Burkholderia pseudomallei]MBF4061074.1 AAA family ATPase [Burkholderia pseudomallei]MBF4081903.1 AAA family ATPase [Burkholderia pseudomallei]CAJ3006714.1 AAA domain protein [Burkholderia pseudomallei]CAJ3985233.1 AAA domain protein [Burkholderia pseudomallei]CAJ4212389.1 AAA domain protein [Burkholderia pseudomallei]